MIRSLVGFFNSQGGQKRLYRVLLGFTGFYWVLRGLSGFYKVVVSLNEISVGNNYGKCLIRFLVGFISDQGGQASTGFYRFFSRWQPVSMGLYRNEAGLTAAKRRCPCVGGRLLWPAGRPITTRGVVLFVAHIKDTRV